MGRSRSFDEATVLTAAADAFVRGGYEATSVDDLVTALGIHRGSLYNAFGSKRGLFLKALERHVEARLMPLTGVGSDPDTVAAALVQDSALDLVLVAAIERGHADKQVADAVRSALALVEHAVGRRHGHTGAPDDTGTGVPTRAFEILGARLVARLVN